MSLTQYYTATTLDGYIADPDNSLEWLFVQKSQDNGPLSYEDFITGIGAMIMGRTTYEWIIDYEFKDKPQEEWKWPYDIPCWVLSHHDLPAMPNADITFTSGEVGTLHQEMLAAAGERNLWVVGGGDLAGQFADEGLLDEVIVSIAPVTLGSGAPLLPRRLTLKVEEIARSEDFAVARYSVVY